MIRTNILLRHVQVFGWVIPLSTVFQSYNHVKFTYVTVFPNQYSVFLLNSMALSPLQTALEPYCCHAILDIIIVLRASSWWIL